MVKLTLTSITKSREKVLGLLGAHMILPFIIRGLGDNLDELRAAYFGIP